MTQSLEVDVRERLVRYLADEATLADFRTWFIGEAWNIDKRATEATAQLVHQIELLLSEHEHGDWTERELRRELAPLVTEYSMVIGEPQILAGASSGTITWDVTAGGDAGLPGFADIQLVKAS